MNFISHILMIILFLFVVVFLSVQFFAILFRGLAPFISTRPGVIKKIFDELSLKDEPIVYELGCGQAGFLRAARKKYPKAKLFGVELFLWPYIVAQIQNAVSGAKIKILKKDFFDIDLSQADLIYCFLNLKTMAALKEKFQKECKGGAQIISYQFSMPDWRPEKTIKTRNGRGGKLFFYKI